MILNEEFLEKKEHTWLDGVEERLRGEMKGEARTSWLDIMEERVGRSNFLPPQEVLEKVKDKELVKEMEDYSMSTIEKLVKEGKLPPEAGLEGEAKLAALKKLGNRFNQGKLQWHLADFQALEPMIKVLMYGKEKYAENQWKNGLSKKEILDSMIRHIVELLAGKTKDEESGELLIGHILCNALFYSYFTTVDSTNSRD